MSHTLNPECEHFEGDMRTVRLGRQFDRVFVHDAIVYMTTIADLRRAIETAFVHCRPGGRGLRYLEWTWDPDPADSTYTVDYAYLLRESDGSVRVEQDRHIEGLFSRSEWLQLLTDAGFRPTNLPFEHSELESGSHEVFVGVRP